MTSVAQPFDSNAQSHEALNEFEAGDYVVLQHQGDEEVIPGDFSTASPAPAPAPAPTAPAVPDAASAAPAEVPSTQEAQPVLEEEQESVEEDAQEKSEEDDDEEEAVEASEENSMVDSAIDESSGLDESDAEESEATDPLEDSNEPASFEPLPDDAVNPAPLSSGASPRDLSANKPKAMSVESMLLVGTFLAVLMAFLIYRWAPMATPSPMPYRYESDEFVGSYTARVPGRI